MPVNVNPDVAWNGNDVFQSTSVNVPIPSGITAGMFMVLTSAWTNPQSATVTVTGSTSTTPWTVFIPYNASTNVSIFMFYKVADAGDAADSAAGGRSWTAHCNDGFVECWAGAAWSGVDNVTPFATGPGTTLNNTTGITFASQTSPGSSAVWIGLFANANNAGAITDPGAPVVNQQTGSTGFAQNKAIVYSATGVTGAFAPTASEATGFSWGTVAFFLNPAGAGAAPILGWDVQMPDVPHRRTERAGAVVWGDDGTEATLVNWRNAGWEVQAPPPRRPTPRADGWLRGEDGNQRPFSRWFNFGWEIQPPPPRRPTPRAGTFRMRGDDGSQAPFRRWFNFGWGLQNHQPPHPRPERFGSIVAWEDGDEAPFAPPVAPPAWGWDPMPHQARKWNALRYPGIEGRSDFVSFNFLPFGWEMQPYQPPHPRPERFGSLVDWEDGNEAPFATPPWGWEFTPPLGAYRVRRQPAASRGDDDGVDGTFAKWFNYGWEIQSHQPRQPTPRSDPHGDDGTQNPFVTWVNGGWEVQASPPSPSRRERAAPLIRGDDGTQAAFVSWRNWGFEVQPPQPNHPRPERSASWLVGNPGTEAPFIPPASPIQWGWEPQHQALRWLPSARRAALDGDVGFASFTLLPWWESQDWSARFLRRTQHPDWNVPSVFVPPAAPNFWGWDPTLLQMPRQPRGKAAGWFSGDPGVQPPLINFVAHGWPVQPWQPPHPRPERSGAWMRGDDGVQSTFVFTAPPAWGWDVYPVQPPFRVNRLPAMLRGDDGMQATFIVWRNGGWEVAPFQPGHPAPERRAAAILRGDDGTAAAFSRWLNFGWEVAPHQPQHPRPERSAAWLRGDDGNENIFTFITAPIIPGWEVAPALAYHLRRESAAAVMRGDDGTQAAFAKWLNAGWEVQPHQPQHPRPERASSWMPIETGIQSPFVRWFNAGWEVQHPQPPHPRPEKSAAWLAGDPGTEAPFIYVPFTLAPLGWDTPFYPPRRFLRIPAFLQGDPGNQVPFSRWFNAGWEVQPWQPPHRRPEQKFAASARGDDGNAAPLIQFFPHGWPVQPPQPPHPRTEKASVWMRGDDGNYNIFRFQPVSYAPFPWDVLLQPPYLRWGRGVMWMPVGLDVVPTVIPKPTVSACMFYGRATLPVLQGRAQGTVLFGDACGCC